MLTSGKIGMREDLGSPDIDCCGIEEDEPVEHHSLPSLGHIAVGMVQGDQALELKPGSKCCGCREDNLTPDRDPTSKPRGDHPCAWRSENCDPVVLTCLLISLLLGTLV